MFSGLTAMHRGGSYDVITFVYINMKAAASGLTEHDLIAHWLNKARLISASWCITDDCNLSPCQP